MPCQQSHVARRHAPPWPSWSSPRRGQGDDKQCERRGAGHSLERGRCASTKGRLLPSGSRPIRSQMRCGIACAAAGATVVLLLPTPGVLPVEGPVVAVKNLRARSSGENVASEAFFPATPHLLRGRPLRVPHVGGLAAVVGDRLATTARLLATPGALRGRELRGLPRAQVLLCVRAGAFTSHLRRRRRRAGRLSVASFVVPLAAPPLLPRRPKVGAPRAVVLFRGRCHQLAAQAPIVATPPPLIRRPTIDGAHVAVVRSWHGCGGRHRRPRYRRGR
mmetsp:Transcript_93593/g.270398  ORF Transcript_93593/g.270398 Transcript_93593/m.270398 type:complete len:276 (+) Transcript_93593:408-1235(+)